MPKKTIFISLSVLLAIGLIAGVFQYVQTLKAEQVSAVTTPNPGHTWAQMECNPNSLCIDTANGRVGIGTNTPSQKLTVIGNTLLDGATTVYNDSGSALLTLQPAGGANNRQSTINFWSTFANFPGDAGTRLAARITAGFSTGVWGTEYMSFGVGGAGDAANPPTEKMRLDYNGKLTTSGDVCNGSGKCLSSVFQTNVIVGSNPTCPAGQTPIMQAYNQIWYIAGGTPSNSWTQVSCGQIMSTSGGTALVNNTVNGHTTASCVSAGGTVVSDSSNNTFCHFNTGSCPGEWTQYQQWSEAAAKKCDNGCSYCITPARGWGNDSSLPTCHIQGAFSSRYGECYGALDGGTCTASLTMVGCY